MMAFLIACGGGDGGNNDGGVIVATIAPTEAADAPTATLAIPSTAQPTTAPASTPAPTATASASGSSELHGFIFPITGACLPKGDQLMPNAPREYRQGTHEGVDMYGVDNCTAIGKGTPVMAAKAGRVIRVDTNYVDLTPATLDSLFDNPTTAESLDAFRGRQVWIDHGNGIVTRYCHLSGVAEGLQVGAQVSQGQLIAYVGESGTPESVSNPGHEYHLHFELRIGDSYLGDGQAPAQVRSLYQALFQP
jgi:murein DD-endopeptidase MepM/ murein hydrolase activator NlpD